MIVGATLLLTPWALSAQTLTLDDFDGVVELKAGSVWKGLDLGAKIPYEATIRISGHGLAELRDGGVRIHLSKDGSYQLSALVSKAKEAPATSLLAQTVGKVGIMLGDKTQAGGPVQVANMGARGAAVDSTSGVAWSGDESTATAASILSDIETLTAAGKVDQAMAKTEGAMKAGNADLSTLRLMKARILAQMGRSGSALREALAASVPATSSYYPASVLLISTQAVMVEDWDTALTSSRDGRKACQDPEVIQNLDLLQALALGGQGQTKASRDLLQQVVNEDPTSGAGQQATQLLKS